MNAVYVYTAERVQWGLTPPSTERFAGDGGDADICFPPLVDPKDDC